MKRPSPESRNVFHLIKYYAVEIAATVTVLDNPGKSRVARNQYVMNLCAVLCPTLTAQPLADAANRRLSGLHILNNELFPLPGRNQFDLAIVGGRCQEFLFKLPWRPSNFLGRRHGAALRR